MTTNEINKKIDLETSLCIEKKFDFWQFKARRNYEPQCRAEATKKYEAELNAEMAEKELLQDQIEAKLGSGQYDLIVTLVVAILILAIVYYIIS